MLVKSDIIGAERLEERSLSALFAYQLQDRFRITAILGAHLLALGIGAALLFAKAVYLGGLYDTMGLLEVIGIFKQELLQ